MQMRISLFELRRDIALSLSLSLYLKIHSLQELLNGTRLLPISLTPLAPLRFPSPRYPVVQYLDVYELEVAYPVVHDALPQPALVHLYHIDYVPLLKQCSHANIRKRNSFIVTIRLIKRRGIYIKKFPLNFRSIKCLKTKTSN